MYIDSFLLITGFVLIAFAANLLVDSSASIAKERNISPLIIGLTIIAFGTSAPEMVVSITASLNNTAPIAIGNAIGSNIANIGLVLGLTCLIRPITIQSRLVKREYPLLLLTMFLVLFLIMDNHLSQFDGLLLLLALSVYVLFLIKQGKKGEAILEKEFEQEPIKTINHPIRWLLLSLLLLPVAAELIVYAASHLARALGVNQSVIGLSIVALGTSLPEVATSISGILKKEDDIAIGNILGSNIFNLLAVLPLAASKKAVFIHPTFVERDFFIMVSFSIALILVSFYKASLPRLFAFVLLGSYLLYFIFLLSGH